ncbi:TonB-dependent receptor [Catenovulum agarivorans DS-2]|uniref:TonB-dependent receptor n=1 Tax=Catenovulum agarivorans DS-2 TaxID=1328313 RepID=W7QTU0_9ALTE|nr:TonB-dependent receptor [Catenovulum agarivorans]EWH08850.1 TonB-dependent receptor [Catenovulum agarivorans DS-2]
MNKNTNNQKQHSVGKSLLVGGSASLLMSLFTPSVLAAEVSSVLNANNNESEEVETIEVTGVRGSLESALLEKREALSIVDAISAKDMDSLPALDLGEAMQSIPGVQLNTDDSGRNSHITLRGLPGGYAKVIAEGQSFAIPSRSRGVVGASNPFGAFEASVFDGVTVIKATTADLQEGGMAGVVNKKLQRALGSKDGKYSVGIGGRYEELTDDWNTTFKLSASKHIIKDKLAVAIKMAGSKQVFRSDTANFTEYVALNSLSNNQTVYNGLISPEDLEAYKAEHGINEPLSVVKAIGKAHQVTVNNRGRRFSTTGNIEWKPTDELKLGANFLYTIKNMDDSNMEDVLFQVDRGSQLDTQRLTPLSAPIRLDDIANPDYNSETDNPDMATIPVYAVTHSKMTNVSYKPSNRLQTSKDEAKGIFLYADYVKDDWKLDATVTRSSSVSEASQEGIDLRLSNKTNNRYQDLDDGQRYTYAVTGINGEVNTGRGNLKNAFATVEGFEDYHYADVNGIFQQTDPATGELIYDLGDNAWKRFDNGWTPVRVTRFGSNLDPKINPVDYDDYPQDYFYNKAVEALQKAKDPLTEENIAAELAEQKAEIGGKSLDFYVNGRYERPERDMKSFEFNAERYTDIGGDSFLLTSVKSGFRHSRETLEAYDRRLGSGGISVGLLDGSEFYKDQLTSDSQNEFFNGDYPNHFGSDAGWQVLDSKNLKEIIQTDMVALDENGEVDDRFKKIPGLGFAEKLTTFEDGAVVNANFRQNFSADQAINAVYLMGKFEGYLGDFSYTGNAGVRYVETSNDVVGQGFNIDGNAVAILTETNYTNTLPSFNLAVDLTDDVVFRSAYSKALVRPNLLSQTPSPVNTSNDNRVRLENSKAEVLPYTSDNYDLSLAWYNRDGSSISAGFFYKEIEGKIVSESICPIGNHEQWGTGELGRDTEGNCIEVGEYQAENGEVYFNRDVSIKHTYNSDIPVKVYGYELSIQQKLDFLAYPWNGFGGKLNFTKIDLDEGGGIPMTKIAPHTANLIAYWENHGASIQFIYNWQDEKLLSTGTESGTFLGTEARTQTSGGRLDMAARYRFKGSLKGLSLNLKAINLNNRQEYEFIGGNDKAINRIRYQGRIIQAGIGYSF